MTAKEMFEKIEYKVIQDDYDLLYQRKLGENRHYIIAFYKNCRQFAFYEKETDLVIGIDIDIEFKAIEKQIEELGWL